jgi:hypothetical protein
MTVSTLRPDTEFANTGALTGGASSNAVLSDDSDASYVTLDNGDTCWVGFGNFTLPAGAVVKSVALRARLARTGSSQALVHEGLSGQLDGSTNITWSTPTTVTLKTAAGAFTEAEVDALDALLSSSLHPIRVHELYGDATYVAIPVVAVDALTDPVTDTNQPTTRTAARRRPTR